MQLDVHSLAPFVRLIDGLTILGVVTGTAKSFDWLDGMLSDKGREAISQWLMNAPSDVNGNSWAAVFPYLIDRVFGSRALSIRFFLRSCVASAIAVLIVSTIMCRAVWGTPSWSFAWRFTGQTLLLSIGSNMLPDYCSLVLSRTIVRMMRRRPRPVSITLLLVLDIALTGCIGVVSANLGLYLLHIGPNSIPLKWLLRNLFEVRFLGEAVLIQAGMAGGIIIFMRILFFSSFFTSIWVWLYVVSGVLVKMMKRGRLLWRKVSPYVDIERKPLSAMGRVAGLLAGATYVLLLVSAWLFRH